MIEVTLRIAWALNDCLFDAGVEMAQEHSAHACACYDPEYTGPGCMTDWMVGLEFYGVELGWDDRWGATFTSLYDPEEAYPF